MFYYLLNRLPVVFGILIFILPLLSRNRTYRTATLFAALNAGFVSILFFVDIRNLGSDAAREAIGYFSFLTLPALYFASLLLGATVIARGTRNHTKPLRTALVIIGSALFCSYLAPLLLKIIVQLIDMLLLDSISAPRFGRILKPEFRRETVALAISTAASAIITTLIMQMSENRGRQESPRVDTPPN